MIYSYTSLSLYKKCPRAWEWRYIHGRRGRKTKASERGDLYHKYLEDFFRGGSFPGGDKVLAPWRPFLEKLKTYGPTPEAEVAVNRDWTPAYFNDEGAYIRGKLDLVFFGDDHVREIIDWKTGKPYPDHEDQGLKYVALDGTMSEKFRVRFVYLDAPGMIKTWNYDANHRRIERIATDKFVEIIESDKTYEPTPSLNSCRFCELSWRVGGECRRAV